MPIKNETPTRFKDEIRIISPWAYGIAALAVVAFIGLMIFIGLSDKTAPPLPLLLFFGLLGGTVFAGYILLIGYVNMDAGRRGMSRVLWTLLAIFVPNALGIVLYFVLRKPRVTHCPQCAAVVEPGFGFCPQCRCALSPVCPHCQHSVHAGDRFCPYCGSNQVAV